MSNFCFTEKRCISIDNIIFNTKLPIGNIMINQLHGNQCTFRRVRAKIKDRLHF